MEVLREWTSAGVLICPGCEQLLRLRVGQKRRRHFAHRTLKDCPLARKSPEVLEAQFLLYQWLDAKYPGKVELDMVLSEAAWPVIPDIQVKLDSERKLALWIFDRQQKNRFRLIDCQDLSGVRAHFVHTQSTLKLHSEDEVALTASQRDFEFCSDFDRSVDWGGRGHLHFLDNVEGKMRVFRGLRCVHSPNLFGWKLQREFLVADAELHLASGEIVCTQDLAALKEWGEKTAREATEMNVPAKSQSLPIYKWQETVEKAESSPQESVISFVGPFRCEDCGDVTSDWTSSKPGAGTCVCRRCNEIRWRNPSRLNPRS